MKLAMIGSKAMELKELINEQKIFDETRKEENEMKKISDNVWKLIQKNIPEEYQKKVDFAERAVFVIVYDPDCTRLQLLKHALKIKNNEDYREQFNEELNDFLDSLRCDLWARTNVETFISCVEKWREETQEIGEDICQEAINGAYCYAEDAIYDTLDNLANIAENLGIKGE